MLEFIKDLFSKGTGQKEGKISPRDLSYKLQQNEWLDNTPDGREYMAELVRNAQEEEKKNPRVVEGGVLQDYKGYRK